MPLKAKKFLKNSRNFYFFHLFDREPKVIVKHDKNLESYFVKM